MPSREEAARSPSPPAAGSYASGVPEMAIRTPEEAQATAGVRIGLPHTPMMEGSRSRKPENPGKWKNLEDFGRKWKIIPIFVHCV